MDRRHFMHLSAAGLLVARPTFAQHLGTETTTPLFVRGLAMVRFGDPDYLQVALPKAPHHVATLNTAPQGWTLNTEAVPDSEWTTRPLEGNITLTGVEPGGKNPDVRLPEVIQARELYPDSVGNFRESPVVISIPWTAVRGVEADVLSEDRWTFVWKDTGEDVLSFRPRRVAESIRIDIVSEAVLRVEGQDDIRMNDVSQVHTDFVPEHEDMGDFSEHFAYYMPYIETPERVREVQPQKVNARRAAQVQIRGANAAFARLWPYWACFVIEVD